MNLGRSLWEVSRIGILLGFVWSGRSQVTQIPTAPSGEQRATTYFVDCTSSSQNGGGPQGHRINSLAQVNSLSLYPGDSVLFKRGSLCEGSLAPRGSGTSGNPIRLGAYGVGPLPRIRARQSDEAALRLYNQSFWDISSLNLAGGTTYGIYASGNSSAQLEHLRIRDVIVHDVEGPLKRKESGLVVILVSGEHGNYDDVDLDGVNAYDTTQWAGIFISGASRVRVRNSTAHDVQGDGIVAFNSRDVVISRSLAWHTGMQHQFTIGTPNAIWTWKCTDCTVENNEAFLTDSPGVDGGSFDIDFGDTRNTVRQNFGHDTVGYCVAVFGAFGPTVDSLVTDNLCLNNGMSPRLAQRQGAVLLMTWQGGTLAGVEIRGNRVYWNPPGETPILQAGKSLDASGLVLRSNDFRSSGLIFLDPALPYAGDHNRYRLVGDASADEQKAASKFLALHESNSAISVEHSRAALDKFGMAATNTAGWRLQLITPTSPLPQGVEDDLRGILVLMKSAALQFGHCGLKVAVGGSSVATLTADWALQSDGVSLDARPANSGRNLSLRLVSPNEKVIREWHTYPSPGDLGLALRQNVGPPDFSRLPLEEVRATD